MILDPRGKHYLLNQLGFNDDNIRDIRFKFFSEFERYVKNFNNFILLNTNFY